MFLPHWPIPQHKVRSDDEIAVTKELLRRLGDPHLRIRNVIHVAGTNGKGSVCAYLTAIFQDAGYRVHRYTSPHLKEFNERIMIANHLIDDGYLYELIERVRIAADGMQCTIFTAATVAAMLAFAENDADIVILEVGMGGRLDQTNVIQPPMLCVITPVEFDHVEFLGTDLMQIATQKCGIIKQSCKVVSSWQYQEVESVIANAVRQHHANLYACKTSWDFEVKQDGFDFIDLDEGIAFHFPNPRLFGLHQYVNAATAVACCRMLSQFDLSYENIANGIQNVQWPARMERITSGVLHSILRPCDELWIDGAHNVHAAKMLAATIAAMWKDKETVLINGRTRDRDIRGFLEPFVGIVNDVFATKVLSEPRSQDPHQIMEIASSLGFCTEVATLQEAIHHTLAKYKNGVRILIAGSLFLRADIF